MEGFYSQKEGGARKLLAKEKKELFQARSSSFLGGSKCQGSSTDYLPSADQIVYLKVAFWGEVETAAKSWFADMGTNDSIWGFYFFLTVQKIHKVIF